MRDMVDESVNLTLTDIPYGEVNRDSNGLRTLDKEAADVMTFDMQEFLAELYRVTKAQSLFFAEKSSYQKYINFSQINRRKTKEL